MDDLLSALRERGEHVQETKPPGHGLQGEGFSRKLHCSALVRLLPNAQDIYVAHDNWDDYALMTRIVKLIELPRTTNSSLIPAAASYTLSGYPGIVYSNDDFYLMDSGLAVVETSNDVLNKSLWKRAADPQSQVPEWIRNKVANRAAANGQAWVDTFVRNNNGLYNNQFVIVDSKWFQPGNTSLVPGTLWVVETLPGVYRSMDATPILQESGFWASYNVNYFDDLRALSGVQAKADGGKLECCDYERCSRAHIFNRDASKVTNSLEMRKLMRYNDPSDVSVVKDAGHAIAARFDLVHPVGYDCSGATDSKVASLKALKRGVLGFDAISSPTYDQRRPFDWNGEDAAHCGKQDDHQKEHHAGLPDVWHFPWYHFP